VLLTQWTAKVVQIVAMRRAPMRMTGSTMNSNDSIVRPMVEEGFKRGIKKESCSTVRAN